jgi:hypothetical protein
MGLKTRSDRSSRQKSEIIATARLNHTFAACLSLRQFGKLSGKAHLELAHDISPRVA